MDNNVYTVKSFACAVFLLAHGFRPVRIAGDIAGPVFEFAPEAREAGVQFIVAKNELSGLVFANVGTGAAPDHRRRA
jgi:hypothetical protein